MDGSSGLANRICYGSKKSKDGLLEIDPETSKNVKPGSLAAKANLVREYNDRK